MGRIVVIGAGIAGLSVASWLARRGREVLLLEQSPGPGRHSSGHSAAIFRLAVAEPINVRLALRSRVLAAGLLEGGLVRETGGLYLSEDAATLRNLLAASADAGVTTAKSAHFPGFLAHPERPGVWSPHDGVIEVSRLLAALEAEARRQGAELRFGTRVTSLDLQAGRAVGVVLESERIAAESVVDATGAFSPDLPGAGHDVGIRSHRRHLFTLEGPVAAQVRSIVWDLTDDVYVRPDEGGVLACACDEEPMRATPEVAVDPAKELDLKAKLAGWAPALGKLRVVRTWAGLRPLTHDHRFVVGPDPLVPGLFRLGGFGGHGMTGGLAAAELAADLLDGRERADAFELRPGR